MLVIIVRSKRECRDVFLYVLKPLIFKSFFELFSKTCQELTQFTLGLIRLAMVTSWKELMFVVKVSDLVYSLSKRILLEVPDKARYLFVNVVYIHLIDVQVFVSVLGSNIGHEIP